MVRKALKTEIIFMNVVFCLMVVFAHISSHPVSNLQRDSLAYLIVMIPWRLCACSVPGFIFLASLKVFLKEEITDYKSYYINRIQSIALPYLIWNLVYYLYFCYMGYFPFRMGDLGHYILIGNLVSPFYFIILIFQFYALMPFWQKVFRRINPVVAVVCALALMLLYKQFFIQLIYGFTGKVFAYDDRIFLNYFVFWVLGCVWGLHYEKMKAWLTRALPWVLGGFVFLAAWDIFCSYRAFALYAHIPYLETLHNFYSIGAIFAFMGIGYHIKEHKVLTAVSSASFGIYLSHSFVILLVNEAIAQQGITSIAVSYVIRFFAVYIITISLCVLYTRLRNRLPSNRSVLK